MNVEEIKDMLNEKLFGYRVLVLSDDGESIETCPHISSHEIMIMCMSDMLGKRKGETYLKDRAQRFIKEAVYSYSKHKYKAQFLTDKIFEIV